jgi:hypothetical protein
MALPLNVFKTITKVATTNPVGIYTAPVGYTGVVLLAQCANISNTTHTTSGIAVTTEILKDFAVQGNDSVSLLSGKLTLESNDVLVLSASNASNIKFIASVLETLN